MPASKGPLLKVSTEEDIPVSAIKTWNMLQKEGETPVRSGRNFPSGHFV